MISPERHKRRPESCMDVESIQFTGDESGRSITRWIEAVRGRGAALYEEGKLFVPAEQYAAPGFTVPLDWYVYREMYSDRFHAVPARTYEWMYA